eukprot:TRINITY_DN58712_c0_g2_i1.p1 TRINITY_DN58712_c0_g2~~TRINITY_DN58712_c0_g2_i1.p1  ORF type:complete len:1159 (+),score=169.54 TRINITY_DN58712_c0_g2_i1:50-3526(+)
MNTACIILLAFCATWVYATEQDVRHVSLKFTPTEVEVVKSVLRWRDVEFDSLHRSKQMSDPSIKPHNAVHIYYHLPNDQTVHTHTIPDPLITRGEWGAQKDGTLTGTQETQPETTLTITVPERAVHVTVQREGDLDRARPSFQHKIRVPREPYFVSHPKFAVAQADGADGPAELLSDMSQQVGNPSKHKNIVFLAGGYTKDEKTKYMATVQAVINFLNEGKGSLSSAPWNRYMSLINYYVVWQPSVQSGASFPLAADGTGGHPTRGEDLKANNLNCQYGTKILRLLNCDFNLMQQLAFDATPAEPSHTTIVTFVNDDLYGGSGGWRTSSLYAGAWQECDPNNRAPTGSNCIVINEGGKKVGWEPSIGNKFLRVFIHELGHADVDLADEYDYGFNEEQEIGLQNCAFSNDETKVPWHLWIDHPLGVSNPVPVCSYENYFKPTDKLCLMEVETSNEYCAQCAESVIRAIYRDTEVLAAPRCPKEDETMVITNVDENHNMGVPGTRFLDGPIANPLAAETGAHLNPPEGHPRINSQGRLPLRIDDGEILTTWEFPSHLDQAPKTGKKATAVGNSQVTINGAKLGIGDWEYKFTITDNSEFVPKDSLPEDDPLVRNMTKTAIFRVKVVADSDPDFGHCRQGTLRTFADASDGPSLNTCPFAFRDAQTTLYCGICDAGKICNDSFPAVSLVQAEANIDAALDGVEDIMFGLGGALLLGGIILFIIIWFGLAYYFRNDFGTVIPFPLILRIGRWAMMIISILVMLFAIAIVVIGIFVYNELSAFGRAFVLVAIIFAAFLYILAFMGFTAAYFRSKVMLTINGIILTLLVIVLMLMAVLIFYIGNNTESETLRDDLRDSWVNQVKKNPKSVCSFETTFECSGFINSCSKTTVLNSECPKECDITHRDNPDPCFDVFQHRIEDNFTKAGLIIILIIVALLVALIINWAMCCCIRSRKLQLKARLDDKPAGWATQEEHEFVQMRAIRILKNLTPQERELMRDRFRRHDKDGSGKLDAKELKRFYSKALDQDITLAEAKEAISRLDSSGDGKVSFEEFLGMYCNEEAEEAQKKQLLDNPRIAHLDRIEAEQLLREFRKIDKDGSGKITLPELKNFYRKLYSVEPDHDDLQRALKAVDNDNNGKINFFEFVQMFAGKARGTQQKGYNQK